MWVCFWVKLLLGFSVKLPLCVRVWWESWVWICHLGLDLVQRTRSSSNASWSERSQGMTKIFTLFPKLSFINWSPGIYSVIFLFLLSHTHLHFLDIVYLVVKGRNMFFFFLLLVCNCWNSVVNCCLLKNFYFILFYMVNCIRLINQNRWLQRSYGSYLNLHGPTTFGLLFTLNKLWNWDWKWKYCIGFLFSDLGIVWLGSRSVSN